jgi:hypothetical protein
MPHDIMFSLALVSFINDLAHHRLIITGINQELRKVCAAFVRPHSTKPMNFTGSGQQYGALCNIVRHKNTMLVMETSPLNITFRRDL